MARYKKEDVNHNAKQASHEHEAGTPHTHRNVEGRFISEKEYEKEAGKKGAHGNEKLGRARDEKGHFTK
jgi:hypothetical protein